MTPKVRADNGAVLPFGPAEADPRFAGPRHAFVLWLRAVENLDREAARLARQELAKRYGILVSLASSHQRKGGAR